MTHLTHRQRFIALFAAGALVVLTLGGLTWLLLGPGDDEPVADATTTTTAITTTSSSSTRPGDTPPTTRSGEGDSAALDEYPGRGGDGGEGDWHQEPGLPLPPMGIAETSLTWTDGRLPVDDDYWLHRLFRWDGRFIASGGTWDEMTERESTALFESGDGITWAAILVPPELDGDTHIVPAGDTVVAFVNRWDDDTPDYRVFVSDDLLTWNRADLSGLAAEDETLWLWHAAKSGETLILAGNREPIYTSSSREDDPIVIEKDGFTLELDNMTGSFVIADDATGEVVLEGSMEEVWGDEGDEESARLYDPATGQLVFDMPWEDLNETAMGAYEAAPFGGDLILEFESEGRRMTVDQFTGDVVVTDIVTGDVVFTATEADLWQGRPPTFIDPSTGTVIVSFTWEEWERAHEEAYQGEMEPEWQAPEAVLLASRDGGVTFTEIDLTTIAGEGFHPTSVAAGPAGFVIVGHAEGQWIHGGEGILEPVPVVLTSSDGMGWTKVTTDLSPGTWINELTATDDGFIALAGSDSGSAVLTTADGTAWTEFLTGDDLLLPLGSAWFEGTSDGGFGVVVTGTRDGWEPSEYEPEPVLVSKQGRTLTMTGPKYTLVDDATGAILFEFDETQWDALEPESDPETSLPIRWGEGGFAIFSEEGSLLFAVSHEERWGAEDAHHPDEWYEPEQVLLRHDGAAWSSIELPEEMGPYAWFSALSAGEDRIVMAVNVERPTDGEEWTHELMVFVGTD